MKKTYKNLPAPPDSAREQQTQRHRGLAASSIKKQEITTSPLQQEHLKLAEDKKAAGTFTVGSVNMANNPGLRRNATSLL